MSAERQNLAVPADFHRRFKARAVTLGKPLVEFTEQSLRFAMRYMDGATGKPKALKKEEEEESK